MTAKESVKQKVKAEYDAEVEEYKKNENYLNPGNALAFGVKAMFAKVILGDRLKTKAYDILDKEPQRGILSELYGTYCHSYKELEYVFNSEEDACMLINIYLRDYDSAFENWWDV